MHNSDTLDDVIIEAFFAKVSGVSEVISAFFVSFQAFPPWILVLVLSTLTAAFTEVTSNVATATIFLPILAELVSTQK
jgi:sodium-dependent dicarboxylate transporter 2/3/5